MFALPISGRQVHFYAPEGRDDLLFAESPAGPHPAWLRVEAVRRLVPLTDQGAEWDDLPYADVDAALLWLRQRMTGDRLVAEIRCSSCAVWSDTELSIDDLLRANRPRRVANVECQPDGWFQWRVPGRAEDSVVRFRAPSVAAVLRSTETLDTLGFLVQTCVQAPATAAFVSSLLERIAPALAGEIRGICPQCDRNIRGWFDPGSFVLTELQQRARGMFEQVHLLAAAYGWSEDMILSLPSGRRAIYAAHIQQERGSA